MCGINQDNAEFLCLSTWGGVLKSSPSDNCPTPSGDAWDPAVHIYPDPSGGAVVIIEAELLDRLEQYPQDIYLDATRLDWDDNGEVVVASEGQLSRALGLRKGDVLLDVNGYPFGEILDTVQLYSTLRGAPKLKLAFARDGRQQTAQYRIQ